MTRINVVHPSILSRKHLVAEWHEISRVITLAENGVDASDIPARYTMGKGHMKFFVDKLSYITYRMALIANEMEARGFKVDRLKVLNAGARVMMIGFGKPWKPDYADLVINLERLIEREPDNKTYQEQHKQMFERIQNRCITGLCFG